MTLIAILLGGGGLIFSADVDPPPSVDPDQVEDDVDIGVIEAVPPAANRPTGAIIPCLELPRAIAQPGAYVIRWDDYRTDVVIEDSAGLLRPTWIVTREAVSGKVVVAYRGQAFCDKDGVLHIDGRRAILTGPMSNHWSPDSFAIGRDRQVSTIDDQPEHPGNSGQVEKLISPAQQQDDYRRMLRAAQAIIEGNI
jgi:hypothetical protein